MGIAKVISMKLPDAPESINATASRFMSLYVIEIGTSRMDNEDGLELTIDESLVGGHAGQVIII